MPGFDRKGPNGEGAMTGRKNGLCTGNSIDDITKTFGRGAGRMGFGRHGTGRRSGAWMGRRSSWDFENTGNNTSWQNEMRELKDKIVLLENKLAKFKKQD